MVANSYSAFEALSKKWEIIWLWLTTANVQHHLIAASIA